MRIALDAMGGDYAPGELVSGAFDAVRELGVEVILVGERDRLEAELAARHISREGLSIVHAPSTVPMGEHHPAEALRKYRDSSVMMSAELVARGEAAAFVSAGNTGAAFASSLLRIKRIPGIDRPAIGTVFPTTHSFCFLIDAGANVDSRPHHLYSFGLMGSIYADKVMGISKPRVALLSNGEEEGKGNGVTHEAYSLFRASRLNFIGSIEGKDIPFGKADVVVTDGFTGNVVLKLAEGLGTGIMTMLKDGVRGSVRGKLGGYLLLPVLRGIKDKMDYAEYGGAPLLGVNGIVIIAHGRSNARAIRNSLKVARDAVEARVVESIQRGLKESQGVEE